MRRLAVALLCVGLTAAAVPDATQARGGLFWKERPRHSHPSPPGHSFQRVGTFANYRNNLDPADLKHFRPQSCECQPEAGSESTP